MKIKTQKTREKRKKAIVSRTRPLSQVQALRQGSTTQEDYQKEKKVRTVIIKTKKDPTFLSALFCFSTDLVKVLGQRFFDIEKFLAGGIFLFKKQ